MHLRSVYIPFFILFFLTLLLVMPEDLVFASYKNFTTFIRLYELFLISADLNLILHRFVYKSFNAENIYMYLRSWKEISSIMKRVCAEYIWVTMRK